jgi:geranylgeranyl diphosphate synthase type II
VSGREPGRQLYDPLRAFTRRPGKGIRGALCLATCEAFGGTLDDGLPLAAAVELMHAAFLIHDDIEDGSERRRGGSALHVTHGIPFALNAGDALATLALRPILDNMGRFGARMTRRLAAEFQQAMENTVAGQAIELGWRTDPVAALAPADYLDMVLRKTCAYSTILPVRAGALLGSWGDADLDPLTQLGFALGAAFQIQDDVLDIVSDGDTYGKDVFGDVREGKRTLMMIHLLAVAGAADRDFVIEFLAPDSVRRGAQVERVVALMHEHGSIDYATDYAASVARLAEERFDEAFRSCPGSPALDFLRALVPFMVDRPR